MSELRHFRPRFVELASDRIRRSLAAVTSDLSLVTREMHTLGGEAAMLGLAEIAIHAQQASRTASDAAAPAIERQLACARMLRSLMKLVSSVEQTVRRPPSRSVGGTRAVVIDDSELVACELADGLRDAGFVVSIAITAERAVEVVREQQPQVVLIDANLPDVELSTLCERIREHSKAQLIVVSGVPEAEVAAVARRVSAAGSASKLSGITAIVERVRQLVGVA